STDAAPLPPRPPTSSANPPAAQRSRERLRPSLAWHLLRLARLLNRLLTLRRLLRQLARHRIVERLDRDRAPGLPDLHTPSSPVAVARPPPKRRIQRKHEATAYDGPAPRIRSRLLRGGMEASNGRRRRQ